MRTWGHLFERIIDHDNIALAVWKTGRGKSEKQEVREFRADVERGIAEVRRLLLTGDMSRYPYRYFLIHDPKERLICAAPFTLRVMHHALMNVCGPLMDSKQIAGSYACRKGKGQYAALAQARAYHRRNAWVLKLDVRKYYDSISHEVLRRKLRTLFREPRLMELFDRIIDSYHADDGRGLPIGNLTSQYLANHYLCAADHYAQETLRARGYVRYMDDILLWGRDRATLTAQGEALREALRDRLGLELKTFQLRRTGQTTEYLGYRLAGDHLLLSQRSMRRYRSKTRAYVAAYGRGEWGENRLLMHLQPLTTFVRKSDDMAFRRRVAAALQPS